MHELQSENAAQNTGANMDMDECIQNCLRCFKECEEALANSFNKGNEKSSEHFILLKSCADICQTSAKFMIMKSKFHTETCGICAKICNECADVCESMGDESISDCIAACRECAESCGQMAKMGH